MAVPKRKTSKSKRDMRSASKGLVKKINIAIDYTGKATMSHMFIKPKRIPKKKDEKSNEE